jgi:hypothetical protein
VTTANFDVPITTANFKVKDVKDATITTTDSKLKDAIDTTVTTANAKVQDVMDSYEWGKMANFLQDDLLTRKAAASEFALKNAEALYDSYEYHSIIDGLDSCIGSR